MPIIDAQEFIAVLYPMFILSLHEGAGDRHNIYLYLSQCILDNELSLYKRSQYDH